MEQHRCPLRPIRGKAVAMRQMGAAQTIGDTDEDGGEEEGEDGVEFECLAHVLSSSRQSFVLSLSLRLGLFQDPIIIQCSNKYKTKCSISIHMGKKSMCEGGRERYRLPAGMLPAAPMSVGELSPLNMALSMSDGSAPMEASAARPEPPAIPAVPISLIGAAVVCKLSISAEAPASTTSPSMPHDPVSQPACPGMSPTMLKLEE